VRPAAHLMRRAPEGLLCVAVFAAPLSKLRWRAAHDISLADVFSLLFALALVFDSWRSGSSRVPRPVRVALAYGVASLLAYLAALTTTLSASDRTEQLTKGLIRFVLHIALLAGGVLLVSRRGRRLFRRALLWLCAGVCVSAAYGCVQLAAARFGFNLDRAILSPVTGVPARTLTYGLDNAPGIRRATGLTTDPNHLGIMLLVPIFVLAPIHLRLQKSRRRLLTGTLLAALLVVQAITLSRSALLGTITGAGVLAYTYRGQMLARAWAPVAAALVVLALIASQNPSFYERVALGRAKLDQGAMLHIHQYDYVPPSLGSKPWFGYGLNNFALEFAPLGKKDFGPHSFYLQALTETGLVGTILTTLFLSYVAVRLRAALRLMRQDPRVWGITAAFAATIVANTFYLTMTFYYFFAFLIFAIAAEPVLRE
jgi:hypothetical protein